MRAIVNKPGALPLQWSLLLILLPLILLTSACRPKNEGTFSGIVNMRIGTYDAGKVFDRTAVRAENVTATLASNGLLGRSHILSFDEKSPLKCNLVVTLSNPGRESMNVDFELGQTCEVRDEKGNFHTAKVIRGLGWTNTTEGARTAFNIELQGEQSDDYRFEFTGNRKK